MKLRDLAKVILVGRESARRIGCVFQMRPDSARMIGISPFDQERVLQAVRNIEHYTEQQLAALEQDEKR